MYIILYNKQFTYKYLNIMIYYSRECDWMIILLYIYENLWWNHENNVKMQQHKKEKERNGPNNKKTIFAFMLLWD